ncbi:MAG: hypothetical protein V7K38_21135 [Nostoc sp.]
MYPLLDLAQLDTLIQTHFAPIRAKCVSPRAIAFKGEASSYEG